jgi:dTDP-4-dehydrorhamnose 3,5-epimerase-like enzyme
MVVAQKNQKNDEYIFEEIILSEDDSKIVKVKPNLWYGFKCIGENKSIITNLISDLYNESEISRIGVRNNNFKYDWSVKHK